MRCGAGGAPENAIELREATVRIDAFGDAYPYLSILVPSSWTDSGAAVFDPGDACGAQERLHWRAVSPDGAASIEILPGAGWTASARPAQFSSCGSRDIHDAAGFARHLLATAAPRADIRETLDRQDLSEPVNAQFAASSEYAGKMEASAAEIRFDAPSPDGAAEQGAIVALIVTFTPPPFIPENEARATAFPALMARARGAAVDMRLMEAVRASALASPRWQAFRERMLAPPGVLPDPRKPISAIRAAPEFSERETAPEAGACGGRVRKLTSADIWKGDDGRYWLVAAGPVGLEPVSGIR